MWQDFVFAVLLLIVGCLILGIGAYSVYHQKTYVDTQSNTVTTEIELPFFGKLKTNMAAVALSFLGLVPIWLGHNIMSHRQPNLVPFKGEISLDGASATDVSAIVIGVTSNLWSETSTLTGTAPLPVTISVPDSWPSYSAFAFALGSPKTRPAIIGTTLGNPEFKLRIAP